MVKTNNNKQIKQSGWLSKKTCCLVIVVFPHLSFANQDAHTAAAYDFESSFIMGDFNKNQIERFQKGNPVLAGEYDLDSYVNGRYVGKQRYHFEQEAQNAQASPCLSAKKLLEFGVRADLVQLKMAQLNTQQQNLTEANKCYALSQWIEDASYDFNQENLSLIFSIPDIALHKTVRGYVDPMLWDRGINAAYLSYYGSIYQIQNPTYHLSQNLTPNPVQNQIYDQSQNLFQNLTQDQVQYQVGAKQQWQYAYASIQAGINFATWQLRHAGQWQQQSRLAQLNQSQSGYSAVNTYMQRTFAGIGAVLRIGESHSNADLFDSVAYRGIDLSSDDRMLPNSQQGFAPQIRAFAQTNAKVEVWQQGQLIYQTNVAAGHFEINDLYPTGYGGELEVRILQANGEVQKLRIPYASIAQLLRPGMQRYAFTVGQYHERNMKYQPWLAQAKYQRGINNTMTLAAGIQAVKDYYAANLAAAFSTQMGAFSFEMSHANAQFDSGTQQGESYKLVYNKFFHPTATNFTLSSYRYSSDGFYRLAQAIAIQNQQRGDLKPYAYHQARHEFQLSLNQSLAQHWGNLYVLVSWMGYWNSKPNSYDYQLRYSNSYGRLQYSFSIRKRLFETRWMEQHPNETEYMLSFSLPLYFRKSSQHLNASKSQNLTHMGISGQLGERFNYGVSNTQSGGSRASNIRAQYRSDYMTIGAGLSESKQYRQTELSMQGSIVAHAKGFAWAPDQAQTMVLVYAPDAVGAKVNLATGLRINQQGYAVIPYVTPYQMHVVQLNTETMSDNVELIENSHRIAPYAGAISRLDFATQVGKMVYIQSVRANGQPLAFAADIYNAQAKQIGMVSQGSLAMFRTQQEKGVVSVRWGPATDQQCQIKYDIRHHIQQAIPKQNRNHKAILLEEPCL